MSGPEWYCERCRRWVNGACCPGCLRIDPASARWMAQREVEEARRAAEEVK